MKSKSIKLLIITIPVFVLGFFVNLVVNDNNMSLIQKAHADVPSVPVAPGDGGGFGCCQGGQGCESGQ